MLPQNQSQNKNQQDWKWSPKYSSVVKRAKLNHRILWMWNIQKQSWDYTQLFNIFLKQVIYRFESNFKFSRIFNKLFICFYNHNKKNLFWSLFHLTKSYNIIVEVRFASLSICNFVITISNTQCKRRTTKKKIDFEI